jgi:hypothetical protein
MEIWDYRDFFFALQSSSADPGGTEWVASNTKDDTLIWDDTEDWGD